MFFERIERELTDGEPWSAFPVNRMEWSDQHRDYWEIENTQKPTSTHKPLRTNLRFWRNWGFWKWLFSGKQVQYVTLNSSENRAGETPVAYVRKHSFSTAVSFGEEKSP